MLEGTCSKFTWISVNVISFLNFSIAFSLFFSWLSSVIRQNFTSLNFLMSLKFFEASCLFVCTCSDMVQQADHWAGKQNCILITALLLVPHVTALSKAENHHFCEVLRGLWMNHTRLGVLETFLETCMCWHPVQVAPHISEHFSALVLLSWIKAGAMWGDRTSFVWWVTFWVRDSCLVLHRVIMNQENGTGWKWKRTT